MPSSADEIRDCLTVEGIALRLTTNIEFVVEAINDHHLVPVAWVYGHPLYDDAALAVIRHRKRVGDGHAN